MQMYPIFIPYHSDGGYAPMPLGVARWFGIFFFLGTSWILSLMMNATARWGSRVERIAGKIMKISSTLMGITLGWGFLWFAWQLLTGAIR